MALIFADRVKELSSTTGTGTFTLTGAVSGYQSFNDGIGITNTCIYCITDGTDWEVGTGTLSGTTSLTRDVVNASSNADALVDWAAGTKYVFTVADANYYSDVMKNSSNLADLTNIPLARTNLGLGTMALQNDTSIDTINVAANSDGNVARWVMDTAQSGASTIGHWAELATITPPVTSYITLSGTLYLSSKNTIAQRNAIVDFQIIQDAAGLNGTTSKISVRSLDGAMLSADNFMFTAAAATNGTAIKLHIQTDVDYGYFAVSEIHTSDKTGWSVVYNNGATWSATTPTGAVTVTSAWAGAGTYAPTFGLGTITYSQQVGNYNVRNGWVDVSAWVQWTALSGTGEVRITLPFTHGATSAQSCAAIGYTAGFDNGGNHQLVGYVDPGTNYVVFWYLNDNANPTKLDLANMSTGGNIQLTVSLQV